MMITQKRFKVSSAQRTTSGTASPANFRVDIRGEPLHGVYRLAEAYVCNSAYNVNSTNNAISWQESSASLSTTITPGYYSIQTFCSAIATAMTTASASGGSSLIYTLTSSSVTGLVTISYIGSVSTVNYQFGTYPANSLGPLIGFAATDTGAVTGAQTGTLQANVNPLLALNIQVNSAVSTIDCKSNQYAFVIPITEDIGNFFFYSATACNQQAILLDRCTALNIRAVDDSSNLVGLLLDWYFTLGAVARGSVKMFDKERTS